MHYFWFIPFQITLSLRFRQTKQKERKKIEIHHCKQSIELIIKY